MGKTAHLTTRRRSTLYLRLIKILEDHPVTGPLLLLMPVLLIAGSIGWLAGGSRPPSLRYAFEAARVIYLDLFGGVQQLTDATDINNDLTRFADYYDSYDIAATSLFSLSTSARTDMFESVLKMPHGKVRILVLDPRLAIDDDRKSEFVTMSKLFGDTPQITFAECLLSTFALARISNAFKPKYRNGFEVRFYSTTYAKNINTEYFLLGRSYQKYSTNDQSRRFDIIIPYDDPAQAGIDSPHRPAWRIKDRPHNDLVLQYKEEFENLWSSATSLDEVLHSLPALLAVTAHETGGK